MKQDRPVFAFEAAMCESFATAAREQGWTVYPETDGWDLLLVKEAIQIGVEAKLKPNMKVLAQATRCLRHGSRGPHYIAVLVPYRDADFDYVLAVLGLICIVPWTKDRYAGWDETTGECVYLRKTGWPRIADALMYVEPIHFDEPSWVPPVMSDVPAGVKSPVQLTAWKVSALRLVARLEIRGYVTKQDFRDIGLNSSRWYHSWLKPAEKPYEGPPRWVRIPDVCFADAQHPAAFETLLERERNIISGAPNSSFAGDQ